jgi:hypothetical protein
METRKYAEALIKEGSYEDVFWKDALACMIAGYAEYVVRAYGLPVPVDVTDDSAKEVAKAFVAWEKSLPAGTNVRGAVTAKISEYADDETRLTLSNLPDKTFETLFLNMKLLFEKEI